MTDLAQVQAAARSARSADLCPPAALPVLPGMAVRADTAVRPDTVRAVPCPPASAPRPRPRPRAAAGSGRAAARALLDDALSGVELTDGDRRFLARLSQWDKRNAAIVASLIVRARQRGRLEALADFRQRSAVAS